MKKYKGPSDEALLRLTAPSTASAERKALLIAALAEAWSAGWDEGIAEYKRAVAHVGKMSDPEARA
jgi:hypothetical protein